MQAETREKCLLFLLCAWTFLAAGPAVMVYGGEHAGLRENLQASSEKNLQVSLQKNLPVSLQRNPQENQHVTQLRHWNIGDTVTRNIGGKSYRFRCIDQNYADHMDDHRQGALFLCDEVIPANTGSRYEFETPGDGSHGYVYYPGPIVRFGNSAEYKYSSVRAWLSRSAGNFADAVWINTGVERGYEGQTPAGFWEHFPEEGLRAHYLGSQKLEDKLFLLSVDEAYRYRDWLWKFGPVTKRNPETQISEFCKGYWLRTPCKAASGTQVYIVDLVQGNIRPEAVRSDLRSAGRRGDTATNTGTHGNAATNTGTHGNTAVNTGAHGNAAANIGMHGSLVQRETGMTAGTKRTGAEMEDEEVKVTGTTGVRPAFVLPQR